MSCMIRIFGTHGHDLGSPYTLLHSPWGLTVPNGGTLPPCQGAVQRKTTFFLNIQHIMVMFDKWEGVVLSATMMLLFCPKNNVSTRPDRKKGKTQRLNQAVYFLFD